MRLATWSVNGVNSRRRYLGHWLHRRQPDILALQKIRVVRGREDWFPRMAIEKAGYLVEVLFADDQWGSVAVLIRQGFLMDGCELVVRQRGLPGREREGRLLCVETDRVRVSSLYVPYAPCGKETSEQIRHSIETKVEWLECLRKCVAVQTNGSKPTFLCGDFNVIVDGESEPNTLNRSLEERAALESLYGSGFADLYREFHGDGRPGFNSGTPVTSQPNARLHLILGITSVVPYIKSAYVDLKYRGPIEALPGETWAPGAPVIIEIDDKAP